PADMRGQRREQRLTTYGLDQVVDGTERQAQLALINHCDEDDRYRRKVVVRLQSPEDLPSIGARQQDVEDDRGRPPLPGKREARLSGRDWLQGIAGRLEVFTQESD